MYCSRCGTKAADNAAFCSNCGYALRDMKPQAKPAHPGLESPQKSDGRYAWVCVDGMNGTLPQTGQRPQDQMHQQQQMSVPTATQPSQQPGAWANVPARAEPKLPPQLQTREQVPDPTFSKFIDAPDPPLPFWVAKIMISICSIGMAGWTFGEAWKLGTIRLILERARENIPGIYLLILIVLMLASAICGFASKRSRGAAGCGAVVYFFASAFAFSQYIQNDAQNGLLMVAAACLVFAIVFLVSAAGGVGNIDFD